MYLNLNKSDRFDRKFFFLFSHYLKFNELFCFIIFKKLNKCLTCKLLPKKINYNNIIKIM